MQGNGSRMTPKLAIYLTVCIAAFAKLAFAGFLYLAALDSKTTYISYGLVLVSAVIIGLTLSRLFKVFAALRKMSSIVE